MGKRITELSPQQVALMPRVRDEWIAIGHSCDPMDRERALAGVARAYAAAKLPAPERVFFIPSPIGGAIADALVVELLKRAPQGAGVWDGVRAGVWDGVRAGVWDGVRAGVGAGVWDGVRAGVGAGVGAGVWDGVGAGVWDGVRAGVWDGVGDGVRDGVWDGVGDGVRDGVRAGVGAGVWDGVRAGVWDGVGAGVGDGVGDGVRDGVGAGVWDGVRAGVWDGVGAGVWATLPNWHQNCITGQHEWGLSFYDYFARVGLDDIVEPMQGMIEVARSAGWWWTRRGFAVVTDRPELLHVEPWPARGEHGRRLHCADGPAIRYRDGWALHFWHGTRVPADMIETEWDTTRILREPNAEVRRCAIEKMGWDRFADQADLRVVDDQADPGNLGQRLRLCDVPEQIYGTAVRVLLCTNGSPERDGTRRRFGLTVPAQIADAIEAAAWTYNLDRKTYAGTSRRT